jgi:hypothetical protein
VVVVSDGTQSEKQREGAVRRDAEDRQVVVVHARQKPVTQGHCDAVVHKRLSHESIFRPHLVGIRVKISGTEALAGGSAETEHGGTEPEDCDFVFFLNLNIRM